MTVKCHHFETLGGALDIIAVNLLLSVPLYENQNQSDARVYTNLGKLPFNCKSEVVKYFIYGSSTGCEALVVLQRNNRES